MGGVNVVSKISDKSVDFIVHTILLVIGFIYIFPLIYVIAVSLTPYSEVLKIQEYPGLL